jgi:methoxymalonate biosynthesis protein
MFSAVLLRMGSAEQRARLLPALASGEHVAAFCLTGSGSGSDASTVDDCVLETVAGDARLSGLKRWVTFGGRATLLLVLAATPGGLQAVLVDTAEAGEAVRRTAVRGQLGQRGCEIADLEFEACPVAGRDMVAGQGFGANQVVQTALDVGRFTIACGAWGMAAACLDVVLRDSREHTTHGRPLADYQLVRRHLARLLVLAESGGAACLRAAAAHDDGDGDALYLTILAKLVATTAAAEAASIAVQCTGSRGVAAGTFAERAFRDAKVLEVIEGATEVSELALGKWLLS